MDARDLLKSFEVNVAGSDVLPPPDTSIAECFAAHFPNSTKTDGKLDLNSNTMYISGESQQHLKQIFATFPKLDEDVKTNLRYCYMAMLTAKVDWKSPYKKELIEDYRRLSNEILAISVSTNTKRNYVIKDRDLLRVISKRLQGIVISDFEEEIVGRVIQHKNTNFWFVTIFEYLRLKSSLSQNYCCGLADMMVTLVNFENQTQELLWDLDSHINTGKGRFRNIKRK